MAQADGELVQLYVYDLSGGIARSLSPALLGQQIDAIYHTSIVIGGAEHYFGGGINMAAAGSTPFGRPIEVLELGRTQLPQDIREALLVDLSERYTPESYSLFSNNCNNFSDELAQLLTGRGIPDHIVGLPHTVLSTPFGQMLRPMLAGLEEQLRSMRQQAFTPASASHPYQQQEGSGAGDSVSQPSSNLTSSSGGIETTLTIPSTNGMNATQGIDDSNGTTAAAAALPAPAATSPAAAAAEGPALIDAEHEIEHALAEGMMAELDEKLEELDLKEGRAAVRQQLGDAAASRMAVEAAVKKEFHRLMNSGEGLSADEAEALAVEHVAGAMKGKGKEEEQL